MKLHPMIEIPEYVCETLCDGDCPYLDYWFGGDLGCNLFFKQLTLDNGVPIRCDACMKAEVKE